MHNHQLPTASDDGHDEQLSIGTQSSIRDKSIRRPTHPDATQTRPPTSTGRAPGKSSL